MKPSCFVTEPTRAMGTVIANSFGSCADIDGCKSMVRNAPCIIGRTSIIDVSFRGMVASINCALQLEFSSLKTFFDLLQTAWDVVDALLTYVVDALLTATARF
ncbi:hypothetical protein RHGRI_004732 [Rhododendron griersonianum]|uniref:Uncharacterized protein n=1 Tax=Rhododendron griersonianum TaxID=479676 RepID=A0AAV6LA25_9ERIC|nr:hypothetical protein RHGRI_004732 [Rhododendron griersonianum]